MIRKICASFAGKSFRPRTSNTPFIRILSSWVVVCALAVWTGCAGLPVSSPATIVPPTIGIAIAPSVATLPAGGSQQFTALVTGTTQTNVRWSASAGSITAAGLFTAPETAFSADIKVTASGGVAYATSSSASVHVVVPPTLGIAIVPSVATLAAGESQQFTALVTGTSQTNVRWSASAGSINATGLFTAPATTIATDVTVTASGGAGYATSSSASVHVVPVSILTIASSSLANAVTGRSYSATLSAVGGHPPYQWTIASGALPAGIQLNAATGMLQGTAIGEGEFSFRVGLSDSDHNQAWQNLSLLVAAAAANATCGPPAYACARSISNNVGDFSFALDPSVSAPLWNGAAGASSVRFDTLYNDIKILRCTDANTDPTNPNSSFAVGIGGSGARVSWNTADTLLDVVGAGGNTNMMRVDMGAATCTAICSDGAVGGCSVANAPATFGAGFFSKVNPNVFYSWTWDSVFSPRIYKVTVKAGAPPSAAAVVDFSPALYKTKQPGWLPSTSVSVGEVIEPTVNNGSCSEGRHAMFQAISSGKTGATEPNWALTVPPYLSDTHVAYPKPDYTSGQVAAKKYIYPLAGNAQHNLFFTTAGGITGASQPVWDLGCGTPGAICTDGQVQWMNVGVSSTILDNNVRWVRIGFTGNETTQQPVGVEAGDTAFAKGLSYDGNQGSGIWALIYKTNAQTIYQYNTYTGIETDYVCTNSGANICPSVSATWTPTVVGLGGAHLSLTIHDLDLSQDGTTLAIADALCQYTNDAGCAPGGQILFWTSGSATTSTSTNDQDGHSVFGASRWVNSSTAGTHGYYFLGRSYANLDNPSAMVEYSSVCSVAPPPGPWCYPQFDSHMSWANNLGSDQEPIIGATYVGPGEFPATSPFQYEIIGFSACGQTGEPTCPAGYVSNTQWRFARTLGYQTDRNNFNSFAAIGALSQSGRYYALTSTDYCHFGGTQPGKAPVCGWDWSSSSTGVNYRCGALGTGTEIVPMSNNPGSYAFHATGNTCTQGVSEPPSWCQSVNCKVTDNGITWVNDGVTNGRSDVLIYDFGSAQEGTAK